MYTAGPFIYTYGHTHTHAHAHIYISLLFYWWCCFCVVDVSLTGITPYSIYIRILGKSKLNQNNIFSFELGLTQVLKLQHNVSDCLIHLCIGNLAYR